MSALQQKLKQLFHFLSCFKGTGTSAVYGCWGGADFEMFLSIRGKMSLTPSKYRVYVLWTSLKLKIRIWTVRSNIRRNVVDFTGGMVVVFLDDSL